MTYHHDQIVKKGDGKLGRSALGGGRGKKPLGSLVLNR